MLMTDVSFLMRKRTKLYRQVGNVGLCSPRFNALSLAALLRAVSADAGQRMVLHAASHVLVFIDWLRARTLGIGAARPCSPDGRRRACLPIVSGRNGHRNPRKAHGWLAGL